MPSSITLETVKGSELHFVGVLGQFYAFKHLKGLVEARSREQCLLFALLFAFGFPLFDMAGVRNLTETGTVESINRETQMSYVGAHSTYL